MNLEDVTNLFTKIPKKWRKYFDEKDIDDTEDIIKKELLQGKVLYPKKIFNYLKFFNPKETNVIIVGQDPYHNGNALGYAFGIENLKNINISVKNIFTEIETYYDINERDYSLKKWLSQGVLLLNKSLTVEKACPNSHKYIWISITRKFIERLSRRKNIVFMLWGGDAKELTLYIRNDNFILESTHPSFFSANKGKNSFIGCNHFKICNEILKDIGKLEIKW